MASTCLPQETTGLPSTSLSNSGAQPFSPPVLADVYFSDVCENSDSDDDIDDGLPSVKRSSGKQPRW
jgi:hypothetical protein